MASEAEICNLALTHLGVGKEIQNLDTDKSEEASACKRVYDTCRDTTLRDYPWPFATRVRELSLIEENPNDEWNYSYRYPSDCLKMRRLLSGIRTPTNEQRAPYKIIQDDAGLIVYTDQENACAEYVKRETNPDKYPADFIMALSWRIAMYVAPRLTSGDPYNLRQQAQQMYEFELTRAARNSFNESQPDVEPPSELESSRN